MTAHNITRQMIADGLKAKLIVPELDKVDGLKAHIGEYWFYFGGTEFEVTDPGAIPFETLVDEIKLILDDFCSSEDFRDEYMHYYFILAERLEKINHA